MSVERVKRAVVGGILGLFLGFTGRAEGASVPGQGPSRAIVKIYASAVGRDLAAPWRPGWTLGKTGSGAVISERRILTAAHVVDDQTFVQVRLNGTAVKAQARVRFVSHVADLALLELDDPAVLDGIAPLELGELPAVRDAVAAYGFPLAGETLSITDGVVARVEHELYVHSSENLLAIQMDAAIAPGSSGGPVLRDGRIVGVAIQGLKDSTIGCAVPVLLIRQFLDDIADGRLDGIPELGIKWQKLENAALKASLRVPAGETGVLLTRVDASPAGGVLQSGDVLLALAGRGVADDGTVELREGERTDFSLVSDLMPVGARVSVRYERKGVVHDSEIQLGRARGQGKLVPRLNDRNADYFIFGGLGFLTLTQNLLDSAKEWAPASLAVLAGREARPGEEVVLLADILASDVNAGYEDTRFKTVREVDGVSVANLAELVRLVERASGGPFVVFTLEDGNRVTIDRSRAVVTGPEVLARYEVAADRSPRLRALAPAGPARADAAGAQLANCITDPSDSNPSGVVH